MDLERLVLPPGGLLVLAVAGVLLRLGGGRARRRLGAGMIGLSLLALWLCSSTQVSLRLLSALERVPPWDGRADGLQAIVVLGADLAGPSPELGGVVAGPLTLQRARYAAEVHRRTGLPVLASGGVVWAEAPPVGVLLARALQRDFGVPVRWVEQESLDTRDNAVRSAALLAEHGVRRVGLVTHAFHMPRAMACFLAQGLHVVPLPTAFHGGPAPLPGGLLPSARALHETALACHELAGLLRGQLTGWR